VDDVFVVCDSDGEICRCPDCGSILLR